MNDLEFGMLMYPDHIQNWLEFCHGQLIFLIFAQIFIPTACRTN